MAKVSTAHGLRVFLHQDPVREMRMAATFEIPAKLDIARVLRNTLEMLQRNWRALLRPALLYLYLPGVVVGALQATRGAEAWAALASFLSVIPYVILQGGLFRLTLADLRAEPLSTEEALAEGRRRGAALLGLSLLLGLAVFAGLLLLIVPGVLLALAWSVAGPALIGEDRKVMECFGRSAELTRGSRVNILLALLVLLVVDVLAAIPFAVVSAPFPFLVASALIWPAYSAVLMAVSSVAAATIYLELRGLKEGAGPLRPAA